MTGQHQEQEKVKVSMSLLPVFEKRLHEVDKSPKEVTNSKHSIIICIYISNFWQIPVMNLDQWRFGGGGLSFRE